VTWVWPGGVARLWPVAAVGAGAVIEGHWGRVGHWASVSVAVSCLATMARVPVAAAMTAARKMKAAVGETVVQRMPAMAEAARLPTDWVTAGSPPARARGRQGVPVTWAYGV